MRPYRPADHAALAAMLEAEGLRPEEMDFLARETWVLEENNEIKGFFAVRPEYGFPYLIHFCVARGHREHSRARRLVRAFKDLVRRKRSKYCLINIPSENGYLERLVTLYFRCKPYADKDGQKYFLTEV